MRIVEVVISIPILLLLFKLIIENTYYSTSTHEFAKLVLVEDYLRLLNVFSAYDETALENELLRKELEEKMKKAGVCVRPGEIEIYVIRNGEIVEKKIEVVEC